METNPHPKRKWLSRSFLLILLGILIGAFLASSWEEQESSGLQAINNPPVESPQAAQTDEITPTRRNAIVQAAEKVGPAVVSISVVQTRVIRESPLLSPFGGDLFEEFWGRFSRPREYKQKISSLGSGIVISEDGYILTNEHVVRGAEELKVTLTTGVELQGRVVGQDVASDLAVIKIDSEDLPFARLGNSDDLIIGEWAIALGNPFGYLLDDPNPTVTVGVISALNRDIKRGGEQERVYRGMIQTDAAINMGNSGGPLVNAGGEVVGINTFIFSTSRGSEGIGFAIPVNRAKVIIDDLIKYGEVTRAWIGVKVQSLTPLLASSLNLDEVRGVILSEVYDESPAQKAGLKRGDVVTQVQTKKIRDISDWEEFIVFSRVGKPLTITLVRKGVKDQLNLIPEQLPLKLAKGVDGFLGMDISAITPQIAGQLSVTDRRGVVITSVQKGSKAYRLGLKQGDIIRQIDHAHIEDVKGYRKAFSRLRRNERILIVVERDQHFYMLTVVYDPQQKS